MFLHSFNFVKLYTDEKVKMVQFVSKTSNHAELAMHRQSHLTPNPRTASHAQSKRRRE